MSVWCHISAIHIIKHNIHTFEFKQNRDSAIQYTPFTQHSYI